MSMAEKERHPKHLKKGQNNKRTLKERHGEREAKKEMSQYRGR